MVTCPHCAKKFETQRQLAGHLKAHGSISVKRSFRFPLSTWEKLEEICKKEGMTTCQVVRELIETYVRTHEIKIIESDPKLIIPATVNIRIGNGRKARLLLKLDSKPTDFAKPYLDAYVCESCERSFDPSVIRHHPSIRYNKCPYCDSELKPVYKEGKL